MSTPREGQRVAYVGDGEHDLQPGDRGKVLSAAGSGSHVMWSTGSRAGEVILVANFDLVASGAAAKSYDDLDAGSIVTFAVRDTFDRTGQAGLLNALNEEGHLATFAPVMEEAIHHVASRIRQDPSMQEVLANLDPDEGAEFVAFTASVLLRDAFSGEDF